MKVTTRHQQKGTTFLPEKAHPDGLISAAECLRAFAVFDDQ
jgi:hypothetical protein